MAAAGFTAPALRRAWLSELSRHAGNDDTTHWRTPAVDTLVSACVAPFAADSVSHALAAFATERADGGGALHVLLDEVQALWAVLEPGSAGLGIDKARSVVTDAWVDAVAARRGAPTVDRLTGLHTARYLLGRVHELDRMAGDGEPPHLVLLVIGWTPPASPWLRATINAHVAQALRTSVRPDATLCRIGESSAGALVPDDGHARSERNSLHRSLDAEPAASAGTTVTLVPVPDRRADLPDLLDALREQPETRDAAPHTHVRMRTAE